jgi:hypothetical protein
MCNLEKIKETTKMLFDMCEFKPVDGLPICQHPFSASTHGCVVENGSTILVDLQTSDGVSKFRKYTYYIIDKQVDAYGIMRIVREPYWLTWLWLNNPYLDKSTFSELFGEAWVSVENSNGDSNVKQKTLITWFKYADKKHLMTEEELAVYEHLPDTFTVYRGLSSLSNKRGISYTKSLDVAKFFANRFKTDGFTPIILKAEIHKKYALAYFNGRNEDEIVVDYPRIKDKIVEISV